MPKLVLPTTHVQASFVNAMEELRSKGHGSAEDHSTAGFEIREYGNRWQVLEEFERYIQKLRDEETVAYAQATGRVPQTTLWWINGDQYLGRIDIRHWLTDRLMVYGGHIGYDIRPSAQRQGHATAMLAAALPVALNLGIDPALLTCDADNIGSRKVIEANGGVLEYGKDGHLRYWVPTS